MYKIIDNFLDENDFLKIKNIFFPQNLSDSNNFAWNYQKGIVRNPELGPTGYEKNDFMYVHSLYSSDGNRLRYDKFYPIVKPIINKLKSKQIFAIRANLLVPTKEHIYHEFHKDREIFHSVALFYITTCNGFTVLKDKIEVKCKENTMLIFDGAIEHRSVTSTDYPRSVININYV
jgi:sensor histidine kinase YesM